MADRLPTLGKLTLETLRSKILDRTSGKTCLENVQELKINDHVLRQLLEQGPHPIKYHCRIKILYSGLVLKLLKTFDGKVLIKLPNEVAYPAFISSMFDKDYKFTEEDSFHRASLKEYRDQFGDKRADLACSNIV